MQNYMIEKGMNMDSFLTPKGTKLPVLNLKGKNYIQVAWRVVWFREDHPFGRIDSECVEQNDKYVIYKASISIPWDNTYRKLSDSIKREDFAHFSDAHEKAQTGAIGRALALCGYGTQFAPELDEQDRIVDAPLPRKSEAKYEAETYFEALPEATKSGTGNLISEKQRKRLFAISKKHNLTNEEVKSVISSFGFQNTEDITWNLYDAIVNTIEERGPK